MGICCTSLHLPRCAPGRRRSLLCSVSVPLRASGFADVLAWYNKVHESKHARLHDVMQVRGRDGGAVNRSHTHIPFSFLLMWASRFLPDRRLPQTNLVLTNPEASLADVTALLDGPPSIEGMPVVDSNNKVRACCLF